MPETHKDLYAASCNPPRRAKRAAPIDPPAGSESPSSSSSDSGYTASMRPYTPRASVPETEPIEAPPAPAKRGRKPGPLSRSAREAQRRLNHSIIEKARRTKINDALASLKRLVPADYGQPKAAPGDARDDDEHDTDDEYEEGTSKDQDKPTAKAKGKGKKEEKEKEFKLEILVRTVSFLQDLVQHVATLEAAAQAPPAPVPCPNCSVGKEASNSRKRKHIHVEDGDMSRQDIPNADGPRNAKIPRNAENTSPPAATHRAARTTPDTAAPIPSGSGAGSTSSQTQTETQQDASARLPSISSWLPNSAIDPQLLPAPPPPKSASARASPHMGSYLPSPPASTHFDPVRTSQVPPLLNLGPVATAAIVCSSRTPEDESAASLLLQISASSPPFRAVRSASMSSGYGCLPDPSGFLLHADERRSGGVQRESQQVRQAQTPSSMLGLRL